MTDPDRKPDFDLDKIDGKAGEGWVDELRSMLSQRVEVKSPKKFLKFHSGNAVGPYVEYECRGRDGIWRPSGIATTKAEVQFFKFGSLPGGLVVDTEWLREAARLAYKDKRLRREETDGENPTRGVIVTMKCLWDSRKHEP